MRYCFGKNRLTIATIGQQKKLVKCLVFIRFCPILACTTPEGILHVDKAHTYSK
jgi:hypothetical protein